MKKALFILMIFSSSVLAQKLELGFRAEWNGLKHNVIGKDNEFIYNDHLPHSFQLLAGIYFGKNFVLQPRFGADVWLQHYAGFEYSLFLKYKFNRNFYTLFGIVHHSTISDWDFDKSYSGYTHQKRLNMPAFGIGVQPYKGWSLEFFFLGGGNEEISYTAKFNEERNYIGTKPYGYLNWAVKLSVGYTWIFPFDD